MEVVSLPEKNDLLQMRLSEIQDDAEYLRRKAEDKAKITAIMLAKIRREYA